MNTPQLVGACGYVAEDAKGYFLPDRLWQVINSKPEKYDFRWLNYLLNQYRYKNAIHAVATGTSNSMKNISKERLLEIRIPRPSIEEQKFIVKAISDIEALIYDLEKLIKKKQNIFTGTMQSLLSGKIRISDSLWEKYVIGDIGDFYSGLTGKQKDDFGKGNARYITFLNVLNNTVIDISKLESVQVNEDEYQNEVLKGDLFFNTSSETPEEVGMCAVLMDSIRNTYGRGFLTGRAGAWRLVFVGGTPCQQTQAQHGGKTNHHLFPFHFLIDSFLHSFEYSIRIPPALGLTLY